MTTSQETIESDEALDRPLCPGEVALVGAGPGDPALLTLAAARLIGDCDAVIHDALVSEAVLARCAAHAERIFAGKRGGRPSARQQDICARMIALARAGRRVVRLKGGDPFVFGRGGEEIRALAAAGVRFRVVPGITAGIAAPAMAGIPVTDRSVNATLAFLTGHEAARHSRLDWRALVAAFPVLVIYMGSRNLPSIAGRLLEAGMAPTTPLALLHAVTTPQERQSFGTLEDAAAGVLQAIAPSIVVIGDVVQQRQGWQGKARKGS
ncbi:MAG: uroporphyrinogen-III C-methyltransferase [Zetaproteobacteria bacterium]|nr:MAG: uroporphyrinogen-III C-methyltransferase [Zetaproteobacteria bacterium]